MATVEALCDRVRIRPIARGLAPARRVGNRVSPRSSSASPGAPTVEALFARFAQTGDEEIREQLIRAHTKLAEKVARNFRTSGEPYEDIAQEAQIGLVKAVDSFDPAVGVKFSTYATHKITGQIRHYLRDKSSVIRQPGWLHERSRKVARCAETLRQKLNREPTEAELAAESGITEVELREVHRTRGIFRVSSLDAPERSDDETGEVPLDRKRIQSLRTGAAPVPVEEKVVLRDALQRLKRLERTVVYALYYKGLSQTEVAEQLNISCNYVSHILRGALTRLRQILASEEVKETHLRAKTTGQAAVKPVAERVDPLTKLFTGRALRERLEEEILRASRNGYEIALIALDLDGLGRINDTHGFAQGDRLLAEVGALLHRTFRKVDLATRYGGGTFLVMLPHTGEKGKRGAAMRLLRDVSAVEVRTRAGKILPTASAGVAVYPLDGDSKDELIEAALAALVQAKGLGGNRICAAHEK